MITKIFLKSFLALGTKTRTGTAYGLGHNYVVEAGFPLAAKDARARLEAAVKTIDHQALGVDLDLGFEPTLAKLCAYLQNCLGPEVEVILKRGDWLEARTSASSAVSC